jgi:Uma2 family endonuclease
MSFDITDAAAPRPAIDERLVAPETRYEIYDGELVYVSPADGPHGRRHSKISALVESHAGAAFDVACDMLTRTSETSDVAPDVSVFPDAPDPETGGRQLEQLAFEVVSTESLAHAGRKAAKLVDRGVRRVFAIDVERGRALEWSAELATWRMLDARAHIEDPALAAPLPVAALLSAAKADDAVARALIAKHNPEIEAFGARRQAEGLAEGVAEGKRAGVAEGLAEGWSRGRAEAVLAVLAARGIGLAPADRARVLAERDPDRLDRWIARAAICATSDELFGEL